MADTANSEGLVFNLGRDANHPRCKVTGRPYEVGSGALPHEQQTANFVRERGRLADMPKDGEVCAQTGRLFETGSGCLPKAAQTRTFLSELSPDDKTQRKAAFDALVAAEPAGKA
ncbi:hypothetical protein UP10_14485 [Bradyrhizobium sp. LTSPM299]|uniref:hypothetical protein n=1 Tax=Bradyrhizobium sp. LTSPM299 TaxID=1619233 RepID=UPI0005CB6D98|nr:hypothetical protein [Bradyrhizobium sp. LTSPM299]KJC59900.1 hypothetical protein UP10_14485 [Bradyrhizobium sp. LTSPM299]